MTALKQYLLSVTGASLLVSLIMSVLPKGKLRAAAVFTGSLLLVMTVISPVVQLDETRIPALADQIRASAGQLQPSAANQDQSLLVQRIKEQCEAYILDKADELGLSVEITVQLDETAIYPYPISSTVRGMLTEHDKQSLSMILEEELGIAEEQQRWK